MAAYNAKRIACAPWMHTNRPSTLRHLRRFTGQKTELHIDEAQSLRLKLRAPAGQ